MSNPKTDTATAEYRTYTPKEAMDNAALNSMFAAFAAWNGLSDAQRGAALASYAKTKDVAAAGGSGSAGVKPIAKVVGRKKKGVKQTPKKEVVVVSDDDEPAAKKQKEAVDEPVAKKDEKKDEKKAEKPKREAATAAATAIQKHAAVDAMDDEEYIEMVAPTAIRSKVQPYNINGDNVLPSALYIQKEFADLIMRGEKEIELRKTSLGKDRLNVFFPLIVKGTRAIPGLIKISECIALDDAKYEQMKKEHRCSGPNVYKFGWKIAEFLPFVAPITGFAAKPGAQTWFSLDKAQMDLVTKAVNAYNNA